MPNMTSTPNAPSVKIFVKEAGSDAELGAADKAAAGAGGGVPVIGGFAAGCAGAAGADLGRLTEVSRPPAEELLI